MAGVICDAKLGGEMSGGGGGGGGFVTGPNEHVDCKAIVEETILNSPVAEVLAKLNVSSVLSVEIVETKGRPSLVARASSGEVAGAITSENLRDLIRCIREGHSYRATVTELDGGLCRVEVTYAGRAR